MEATGIDIPRTLSNEVLALEGLERLLDTNDDERLAEIAALVRPIRSEIGRKADELQNAVDELAAEAYPSFRDILEAKKQERKAKEAAGDSEEDTEAA